MPKVEHEVLEINTANLAAMLPNADNSSEAHVYELDGPAQAYFEIPLDWFANANAEIEPGNSPGAVRLVQRVVYYNFMVLGDSENEVKQAVIDITGAVHVELRKTREISYIWWRKRPEYVVEQVKKKFLGKKEPRHKVRLRLGTCPSLPTSFWSALSLKVHNASSEYPGRVY